MWFWNYLVPIPNRQLSARTFAEVFGAFLLIAMHRAWDDYERRPRLEFYRIANAKPYLEEFSPSPAQAIKYLRLGIRNIGGTDIPRARLVLEACEPASLAVHPEHELQPTGKPQGTLEFMVAAGGTTIIDVATETIMQGQIYGEFSFCYALALPNNRLPNQDAPYRLTLRAEGGGLPVRCAILLGNRLSWRLDDLKVLI